MPLKLNLCEPYDIPNQFVEIDSSLVSTTLFCHRTNAVDDAAAALAVVGNASERRVYFFNIWRLSVEPPQCRICIVYDASERLVDLMGNRCRHLAHRRQSSNARELCLRRRVVGLLRYLPLARGRKVPQHVVEGGR